MFTTWKSEICSLRTFPKQQTASHSFSTIAFLVYSMQTFHTLKPHLFRETSGKIYWNLEIHTIPISFQENT